LPGPTPRSPNRLAFGFLGTLRQLPMLSDWNLGDCDHPVDDVVKVCLMNVRTYQE